MPTHEQVMEALRKVEDPELHKSLVDLNMIRDVKVEGDRVSLTVALTIQGCPLKGEIQRSVEEAVLAVDGVKHVDVTLTSMTPEERQALFGGNQLQAVPMLAPDSPTRIIAVASGKGGVGKSTVTVNLAAAMRELGHRVGVLDCDIYGFSVARMLGLEGKKPTVIDGKILPMPAYGMKVISMGNFVEGNVPVIWRGPMLGKILNQFLTDVLWGDLDYLFLDLPPGTGDMAMDVARMMPRSSIVLVTTPQAVASGVASRAAYMARRTNQEILGVVENMATFICPHCGEATDIFGTGGAQELADELGVPVLGRVPLVVELRKAGDVGKPVAVDDEVPEPVREAFFELAKRLAAIQPVAAVQG